MNAETLRGRARGSPGGLLWVAVLASFTANVDLSIVNLALPTLGRAFDLSQTQLAWAVVAYVLPYAVSILAVGRLGDRFGYGRVLVVAGLLFALGSLVASTAGAYPQLLAGRVVQGFGGSGLLTIGLALVSANFTGAARSRGLGYYFAAGATAAVVGPLVGGVLASTAGWPAIFWIQIPLAIAVSALCLLFVQERRGARRSLDLPGLALGSLALLGINIALLQADTWGWTSPPIVGAWVVAVLAIGLFVVRERTAAEPAVRLAVFRSRIYVASVLVGGAAWFGILSGTIQLAIYLQVVRGLTPVEAALVLTPWPLIAGLLFTRAGGIVARVGPERAMLVSLALATVAAGMMVLFDATTPLLIVSLVAALGGAPIAIGVTASTVCALAEFPPAEAGIASGVFNSLRQVGSAFGVAIPAAAFALAAGPAISGVDAVSGSTAAFASRLLVFAGILLAAWLILPREHRVTVVAGVEPPQW
ncbi:MAG: MFS transporter [Candidatus Limnocylindrales bacterium]